MLSLERLRRFGRKRKEFSVILTGFKLHGDNDGAKVWVSGVFADIPQGTWHNVLAHPLPLTGTELREAEELQESEE